MKRIAWITLAVAALGLTACGSEDAVSVSDAWARASVPGQTSGAIYFDLKVRDDDTLLGASVPSTVASGAEIHEVVTDGTMADDTMEMSGDMSMEMSGDMSMDGGSGQMRMQEMADGLELAGGETVSFEPGSYHVMLPELVEPLVVGDEFDLTLDFANADDVTVKVEVAETAP